MKKQMLYCMKCIYYEECAGDFTPHCGLFSKAEDRVYCDRLMDYLRAITRPAHHKKLSRKYVTIPGMIYDIEPDAYYVSLINDSLKLIPSGKTAYVYKDYHVQELLRFEPDIKVRYHSQIFFITK